MVHIRKLVKSGTSSHTVSLPKDWLEKNNLSKGDLIYINEENNQLKISLKSKKNQKQKKEFSIEIDANDIGTIRRKTISAYINNYNIFTFHGKSLNKKLEELKKILDNFLALETVEQTATKLVVKDFLNLEEFSIPNTIRRMDMLTRSIITDAKKGKKETDALHIRDFEIDKLFFLMSRLTRSNLSSPGSDITNIDSLSTWWLAKNLESVADSAKNLSQHYSNEISRIYDEAEQYYLECIKSYVKKDKELANNLINKRIDLLQKTDKVKGEQKFLLKSFIKNSRNIAKIVLDSD
ncbi:AbrB/MazE/SpoVT family DNA-binding domain-containing protein [Candidatus Woesearchaeota archaeon]|nr:AbrB/MazE/SpoVT family DNA-binding domain-containing protein [Candidatus Woesearchaeota archaeon]